MYCVNNVRKLRKSQFSVLLHILIMLSLISKQHVYLEASSTFFSVSQNVTLSSAFSSSSCLVVLAWSAAHSTPVHWCGLHKPCLIVPLAHVVMPSVCIPRSCQLHKSLSLPTFSKFHCFVIIITDMNCKNHTLWSSSWQYSELTVSRLLLWSAQHTVQQICCVQYLDHAAICHCECFWMNYFLYRCMDGGMDGQIDWLIDWLIDLHCVQALTVPMHLGLNGPLCLIIWYQVRRPLSLYQSSRWPPDLKS